MHCARGEIIGGWSYSAVVGIGSYQSNTFHILWMPLPWTRLTQPRMALRLPDYAPCAFCIHTYPNGQKRPSMGRGKRRRIIIKTGKLNHASHTVWITHLGLFHALHVVSDLWLWQISSLNISIQGWGKTLIPELFSPLSKLVVHFAVNLSFHNFLVSHNSRLKLIIWR